MSVTQRRSIEGKLLDENDEVIEFEKLKPLLPLTERFEKVYAYGIVGAYIIMVILNVISTSVCGQGKDPVCKSNSDQSDSNPTYLTPDGGTFAIWGIIYVAEAIFTLYQAIPVTNGGGLGNTSLRSCRPYVLAAWLLNGLWLIVFSFSLWWTSLAIMLAYIVCIGKTYYELVVDYNPTQDSNGVYISWKHKLCCYPAFGMQLAWLVVATTLNICVVGFNNEWMAPPDFGVMVIVAIVLINIVLSTSRVDIAYAFVSVWALAGIIRKQENPPDTWNKILMPPSQQLIDWGYNAIGWIITVAAINIIVAVINRNNPHSNYYFSPSPMYKRKAVEQHEA